MTTIMQEPVKVVECSGYRVDARTASMALFGGKTTFGGVARIDQTVKTRVSISRIYLRAITKAIILPERIGRKHGRMTHGGGDTICVINLPQDIPFWFDLDELPDRWLMPDIHYGLIRGQNRSVESMDASRKLMTMGEFTPYGFIANSKAEAVKVALMI